MKMSSNASSALCNLNGSSRRSLPPVSHSTRRRRSSSSATVRALSSSFLGSVAIGSASTKLSTLRQNQQRRNFSVFAMAAGDSNSMDSGKVKLMEFPYASAPTKKLMVELLSTVDEHLGSSLHPSCTLAPDVQHFGNSADTAHASLHLRSGLPSSQIDFILGGWIHCKLPSGGALNITSLSAYLTSSTDAPHFLLELIQSSPTSLVLILDLTPRKDLILYPDYLKTYYEDTQLDRHRQRLQALPEVRPYYSPSLYIRAVVSPTAILVTVDTGAGASESRTIEEIIEDDISPITKDLLRFWIESCACFVRDVDVDASERAYLAERDRVIKNKTIEVDLGSSFPRLFGQEIADRVLDALKEYYNR